MYVLFSIAIIILFGRGSHFSFPQEADHLPHLRLSVPEKVYRLNCLLAPFGFEYQISQDIFVTRLDAWQRDYGYRSLYDRASPLLGMVFDCEPVYFDYQGKTWLLEFWKVSTASIPARDWHLQGGHTPFSRPASVYSFSHSARRRIARI